MRTQTANFSYYRQLYEAAIASSDATAIQLARSFKATWSTGHDGPDSFEKCSKAAIDALCTRLKQINIDVNAIL